MFTKHVYQMIHYIKHQISFLMNIDEKLEKNTGKLRGYTYKVNYILAFNCPRGANLKPYKTA